MGESSEVRIRGKTRRPVDVNFRSARRSARLAAPSLTPQLTGYSNNKI